MSKNHIGYYSSFLMLFLCACASADHPTIAFGINGAGPITTISANTLPSGVFAFSIQSEFIDNDEFSTEQLENFADSGLEGVHSVNQITNTSVSVSYGVTDDLSVSARLPYVQRDTIQESEIEDGEPEAHIHGDSSSMGDLLLLGQYRFLKSNTTEVSVNFGVKIPTGKTDRSDDDGARFETEFQSSSGSWDTLLGVAASKQFGAIAYHSNILYNKTTKGSQSTKIGDSFSYNAAITYKAGGKNHASHSHNHSRRFGWGYMLELNGEHRSKNKISGVSERHSGGNVVYLSPGIRLFSGKFSGFLSWGLPIIENQHGTQADIKKRLVAGISFPLK